MKDRNLLYVPMVTEKELFVELPDYPDQAVFKNLNMIYQGYARLWKRSNAFISKFKNRFSIDRIFIEGLTPNHFKEELGQEIKGETQLGLSIDALLKEHVTVEPAGNPGWELFEEFLAHNRVKPSYQILPYLQSYLDSYRRDRTAVSFLTEWENYANLAAEDSLLDIYTINYECHGKQWSVEKPLLPNPFGMSLIGDIRARNAAERINHGLKKGENGIAYLLYAGSSSLKIFKHSLPAVQVRCYPKLNEEALALIEEANWLRNSIIMHSFKASLQANPLLPLQPGSHHGYTP